MYNGEAELPVEVKRKRFGCMMYGDLKINPFGDLLLCDGYTSLVF